VVTLPGVVPSASKKERSSIQSQRKTAIHQDPLHQSQLAEDYSDYGQEEILIDESTVVAIIKF
jgi:hypothetical protein